MKGDVATIIHVKHFCPQMMGGTKYTIVNSSGTNSTQKNTLGTKWVFCHTPRTNGAIRPKKITTKLIKFNHMSHLLFSLCMLSLLSIILNFLKTLGRTFLPHWQVSISNYSKNSHYCCLRKENQMKLLIVLGTYIGLDISSNNLVNNLSLM